MRVRCARVLGVNLALVVVGASLVLTTSVAPSSPAAAVAVTVGPVEAQMANHHGTTVDTSAFGGGNCIRYSPVSPTLTQSTFVVNPNEAFTAHGKDGNFCPGTVDTRNQSAMGFRPSPITTVEDGTQFLIGRMVHYNNPIQASDRYFVGELNVRLGGFDGDPELDFPWTLEETPNQGSAPNDEIAFSSQISAITVTQGGLVFRLVIAGFRPIGSTASCPATAQGNPVNEFSTVEGTQTHACLYASLQQERSLTIVKQVVGSPPQARTFGYTSSSSLAGSAWANGSFILAAGGDRMRSLTSGETVTVTETDPGDDRWTLTTLTCTQIGANGQPQSVPGATINVAARQMTLTTVPPPPNPNQPGITCAFTNTYTPKATLTLVKQVEAPGTAPPSAWTLTATGPNTISGPSGSAAVTAQRVRAGTYLLTETGTGQAGTGYVQQGNWVCETAGGTNLPVTAGSVTLPDSAQSNANARVTCTVTNRLATGSLQINKVVDAPAGAYIGGATKTFAGNYNCGAGFTAAFTTLTTATPVVITGIPAGRTCTVTETPPTGGLAPSFAWTLPTFSAQPVTIVDNATAQVTITNHVIQQFGTFAVTKVVQGPLGGYTGGTDRVFPVNYTCTLAGQPPTSGTLAVTLGGPESPAAPIPVGSVCSFTEVPLTEQPDDFVDSSYTWSDSTLSPTSVTIALDTTSTVTLTNIYIREFGSLVIAKEVVGDGYLGVDDENFTVQYDCGTDFAGTVTVADGGTVTIEPLPAGVTCDVQEEVPLNEDLLSPAFDWGTPTWDPGVEATIPANGSVTLTVSNPTVPVFGQVRVTKEIAGETDGVVAGATFDVIVSCDTGAVFTFELGVDETESTPNLPVGTVCTVTETDPGDELLVDASYDWGATTIVPETVTVTAPGEVVEALVTNTVVRVTGSLTITKVLNDPGDVVDPTREFSIGFVCVYGGDDPVTGTVSLAAGETATIPDLLLESKCIVLEDPASVADPPDPEDLTWQWLPVTYSPDPPVVVVDSATTPVAVTVVNSTEQVAGSFRVTKAVTGEGKAEGYDGSAFSFTVDCEGTVTPFDLVDDESFASGLLVPDTVCTLTELPARPPTTPEFGWDPVTFTVNGAPAGTGDTVTFTVPEIPPAGVPLQINVTNPITPRFGSVTVTKTVTGEIAGLAPDAPPFHVHLDCGDGGVFELDVPAGGSITEGEIPAGSECTATEAEPTEEGLVDDSYAWGETTYTTQPVTVVVGETVTIGITNPIVRVTAPVRLVKTYTGPQGVVDPVPTDRTYPVTWTCTHNGEVVAGPTLENIIADPNGIVVADAIPINSVCTPVEGDLGTPSVDPAFRWLDPVLTDTTVLLAGPNTMTVANELVRDTGAVIVQKDVTGSIEGYIGGTGENFTLHGVCVVPGEDLEPRSRSGTIANGGEVVVEPVSIGWTCTGVEETPRQDLLADVSYAWGIPIYTPADPFVLTLEAPELVFHVENPIVRVRDTFKIVKVVDDPFGAVADGTTFSGGWSCQYGGDRAITGTWSITLPDTTFEPPDQILLESECTATENPPDPSELPDVSYAWGTPEIDGPATVLPGGTATVTVTNTVERVWAGLEITKEVVDPDGGVLPGAAFPGVWKCTQGENTYTGRYTVGPGETTTAFTPEDELVPVLAECTITEDTPFVLAGLRDDSFAWGAETYEPESVTLEPEATATLGVTNTVVRVYSDVTIRKVVTGPAADLVPADREFTGTISCRYGTDAPIETTWSITTATPALRAGVLVESVCTASEDAPGFTSGPVVNDSSYVWLEPVIGGPVTVVLPDQPSPEIVVTNPTDRLFGTFDVTKHVTGDTEGIVDPTEPYLMDFECTSLSGEQISGELEVPADGTRAVGPEQQIPTGSTCTLTEPLAGMPGLVDETFSWGPPTFTVDGQPVDSAGGQISFMIPTPQEDEQEPNVEIVVTNPVRGQPAPQLEITKEVTSPPARNPDGTMTLAYDIVVANPGQLSITYQLTDTFAFADGVVVVSATATNIEPGNIPTNPNFNGASQPTIATAALPGGTSHRYRVTVVANTAAVDTATELDCVLDPGESGTGFLNRSTVNPTAEACAPIPPQADVRVRKLVDRPTVTIVEGSTARVRLSYSLEITNGGPSPAGDVVVTDELPPGSFYVSATPSVGTCTLNGSTVTCRLGTLAVGASALVAVVIDIPATQPEGNVVNRVGVLTSTSDPNMSNNSSAAITVVQRESSGGGGGTLPVSGSQIAGLLGLGTVFVAMGMALRTLRRRRTPAA